MIDRRHEEDKMRIAAVALLATVLAVGTAGHAVAAGSSCDSLMNVRLENATVTLAELVPAGAFRAPGGGGKCAKRDSFCGAARVLPRGCDAEAEY
jgi:hypothetical protein